MANPDPHKARVAKRKRRRTHKIGDLEDSRRVLWQAIYQAESVLLDAESDALTVLKAVRTITHATTGYARLIEVGELEARLDALEKAFTLQANRGGDGQAGSPPKIRR